MQRRYLLHSQISRFQILGQITGYEEHTGTTTVVFELGDTSKADTSSAERLEGLRLAREKSLL